MIDPQLKPEYSGSRAMIIGIDDYQSVSPLAYAVRDAEAIRDVLRDRFSFPDEDIKLLTSSEATRSNIMSAYLAYADGTEQNDRLLVFFAGHGHTTTGTRGEVGFLVPWDGDPAKLDSLIRWDELTRNAEFIPAKHIIFIMDACYGGLLVSRALPAGSNRFLKDMLRRPVRQGLAAGKADEIVADSGGPRPGHSVFTGHLLDALEGSAATHNGIITGNGVMSYVYDRVSSDPHSRQTPHFGFIEGDGDFFFETGPLQKLGGDSEQEGEKDMLVSVPSTVIPAAQNGCKGVVELAKEYLADPRHFIKLDELGAHLVRKFIVQTSAERLPLSTNFSLEEMTRRLELYEEVVGDLAGVITSIAYWGDDCHMPILTKIVARMTDDLEGKSGSVAWLRLRWYPFVVVAYRMGIAIVSQERYDKLRRVFTPKVSGTPLSTTPKTVLLAIGDALLELRRSEMFKALPGHERQYVALNEYLFKTLQPPLDDLLFLGKQYEPMFDRFEVLLALVHADVQERTESHIWGPVGRFGWKYSRAFPEDNPLGEVIKEAKEHGASWAPLQAGFFAGDTGRFLHIAEEYRRKINGLSWW